MLFVNGSNERNIKPVIKGDSHILGCKTYFAAIPREINNSFMEGDSLRLGCKGLKSFRKSLKVNKFTRCLPSQST